MQHLLLFATLILGIQSQWASDTSGTFNSAVNWGGSIPTETAVIAAVGDPFTVTVESTVNLLTKLELGAEGSFPTLLIDGGSLTVPLLELKSGTISIINGGSLTLGTQLTVESASNVTLEVDPSGTITFVTNGIEVIAGRLELMGQILLEKSLTIAAESEVFVHADASLEFSSQLIANVEITGGRLISAGNTTVREGVVLAHDTTLEGYFYIAQESELALQNIQMFGAQVISEGNTTIRVGVATTANLIIEGYFTVESGAQWTMENVTQTKGKVEGEGEIIVQGTLLLAAETGETIVYVGTDISIQGRIVVSSGMSTLQSLAIQGEAAVEAGASLTLDTIQWTRANITSNGRIIVNGLVQFYEESSIESSGSVESNGQVTIQEGRFSLKGSSTIEGQWRVLTNGILDMEGEYSTSSETSIEGDLTLVQSAIFRANHQVNVTGEIIVQAAASLRAKGARIVSHTFTLADATAAYAVEISSSTSSAILTTTEANLDGSIEVYFTGGFDLAVGETAVVIVYEVRAETFARLNVYRGEEAISQRQESGNSEASDYSIQYNENSGEIKRETDSGAELIRCQSLLIVFFAVLLANLL